ncbi:MAG: HAMP domain-containing sensor histidine kinase [Clostridiales bacterium]|nr:HAMP domain-containing sensor histidine kinase [Clostridiales bacterium]
MGDVKFIIQNKINRWGFLMCIAAIGMAVCCTFFLYSDKEKSKSDQKNPRIEFADAVEAAEKEEFEFLASYECFVTDLTGTVLYSNTEDVRKGQHLNLHSLSTEKEQDSIHNTKKKFISPLQNNQTLSGMLVIYYTIHTTSTQFEPILLLPYVLSLIIIFGVVQIQRLVKQRVFQPILAMNRLCDHVMKGNYQGTIPYDQEDEMGMLSRKLEMVQEELKNSIEHAELLDENEKLLLACVSHDLKTPISTIIGCAEGIESGMIKNQEGLTRYSKIILAKARLLTRMIEEILEFTSAKMDSLLLQKKEVYAQEYIQGVLKQLQVDVQKSGLDLSWGEIPNVLLHIAPNRIYQVFQNIIGNSMKYTNQAGKIAVCCFLWEQNLVVEITDNGQGIAAADIPFVFDRFYRGEKARTQKDTTGSGLGLSIVKSIVERHGGKVECESVLSQGTTIRFTLPMS